MMTLIRIGDWYFEWSSISDSPATYALTREELKVHIMEQYGAEGLARLPERLARVDAKGASSRDDDSVDETIACNRAGEGGSLLSKEQIVALYQRPGR